MKRVDGVQTVTVSLKAGLTVLELRPGNSVTLAALRTVIKNNGFVSKDAQVTARGTLGSDAFVVAGSGERLPFAEKPTISGDVARFSSPKP